MISVVSLDEDPVLKHSDKDLDSKLQDQDFENRECIIPCLRHCKLAHSSQDRTKFKQIIRAACCVIMQTRPLCFAAVFFLSFFICREISAVSRPISAKLCHMIGNGCNFKKQVQNLGVLPPKKFGAENMLFGTISDDFALRSQISLERNKISTIRKWRCKLRSLPHLLT